MHYRFSLLLTIYLACAGFSSYNFQPRSTLLASSSANLSGSRKVAQTPPTDSAEFLANSDYDRLMNAGYEATKQRNYQLALEYFRKALAQRPGDFYASAAIRNLEGYLSRDAEVNQELVSEQQESLWTVFSPLAIAAGVAGVLLFLWTLRRTKRAEADNFSDYQLSQPNGSQASPKREVKQQQQPHPVWEAESSTEEATASEAEFSPKQQTTRLAGFDFLSSLIEELYHPNLTKRRRAIQELGQSGDSRAIKPLIERIIDSDAYEHSLILEALTQISARVLEPMNQALTACLQDPNPQVRKNAIRELTQLYYLMAQVNQLLSHATDDGDIEVKKTAQWAISRLNVGEFSMSANN